MDITANNNNNNPKENSNPSILDQSTLTPRIFTKTRFNKYNYNYNNKNEKRFPNVNDDNNDDDDNNNNNNDDDGEEDLYENFYSSNNIIENYNKPPPECTDRYIPIREEQNWNIRFNMLQDNISPFIMKHKPNKSSTTSASGSSSSSGSSNISPPNNNNISNQQHTNSSGGSHSHSHHHHHHGHHQHHSSTSSLSSDLYKNGLVYQCLLKNELLGAEIEDINQFKQIEERKMLTPLLNRNVFRYRHREIRSEPIGPYSISPISQKSQKMLRSPRKTARKISKMPFKVLDAPDLQDDFYLNLVDWSSTNILSVGLAHSVYLWNACTSQVTRLCEFNNNPITSVSWCERGNLVAVGSNEGFVQIWDIGSLKCILTFEGHGARVGCLAWNGDTLTSGSRDRFIFQRDLRCPHSQVIRKLGNHRQEVCGLKWSPDKQLLASGGNDNRIFIWNQLSNQPIQTYTEHMAAVKAIAWSPHHHGLLASGGGTADRNIRFWNTLTGQPMQCVDTGSQVCNLAWSKHAPELVSTHGYSQNQILVWKYPSLAQVAKLTGHSYRVLYLAMSPDGESIVTGAGDETLRFWNVFSKARSQKETRSALDLFSTIR